MAALSLLSALLPLGSLAALALLLPLAASLLPLLLLALGLGLVLLKAGQGLAGSLAPVGCGVAHHVALGIACAVGGLHHQLSTPVAVEVVDHELCVVRPGADVAAQADAPEPLAAEAVAVYVDRAGEACLRVVVRVGRLPFQEELVLSVAVDVAHAGIVGRVAVAPSVGGVVVGGLLYLQCQVARRGVGSQAVASVGPAALDFVDSILSAG